jgi:hypothetical protein
VRLSTIEPHQNRRGAAQAALDYLARNALTDGARVDPAPSCFADPFVG